MPIAIDEAVYQDYVLALLAGDRARCTEIVKHLLAGGADLKLLYIQLFQRSQHQIGELWEQHRISVAVEHLATAITERMLTLVQGQLFSGPVRARSIVIACVADESHQLGGRMIADFCEMFGWRAYFLGANTPLADLHKLIDQRRPNMLGLTLTICANLPALLTTLDEISSAFPALPILVGGQAFRWGSLPAVESYAMVSYIATVDELEQRILSYKH